MGGARGAPRDTVHGGSEADGIRKVNLTVRMAIKPTAPQAGNKFPAIYYQPRHCHILLNLYDEHDQTWKRCAAG
jgi:hypothetical protein